MKLLLSEEDLKEEIAHLEKQRRVYGIHSQIADQLSLEPNMFFEPTLSLLLQWCKAVCGLYGVPVREMLHVLVIFCTCIFVCALLESSKA